MMAYTLALVVSYFVGCINPAYFISKLKGVDLRETGTGNLGASNAVLAMGLHLGIPILLVDIAKSALSILLFTVLFPDHELMGYVVGCAVIIGHTYPFYLNFDGGKGFAPMIGFILVTNPILIPFVAIGGVAMMYLTGYVVCITWVTIGAFPIWVATQVGVMQGILAAIASVLIFKEHIENIQRIIDGTEQRIENYLFKHKGEEK